MKPPSTKKKKPAVKKAIRQKEARLLQSKNPWLKSWDQLAAHRCRGLWWHFGLYLSKQFNWNPSRIPSGKLWIA
jgi:hypothetical protein